MQFPPDMVEIYLDFWAEGIRQGDAEGRLGIDLKSMYEQFRSVIAAVLDEGIAAGVFRPMNTRLVASNLMAILDGLQLQFIIDRNAFDQSRMADETIDLLLEGLRAKLE
jgi:TetR/AcrR family fatty acid metabolism transcriptional regulator